MYNHIMLEVYCMKGVLETDTDNKVDVCPNSECIPQYSCLANNCPYVTFTSYENALCYVNQNAISEKSIAWNEKVFDNDSGLLEKWKSIAITKINEAEQEFLKCIGKNNE